MDKRLEILLVDDEEIVCKRLKLALEKKGYAVEVSQSGSTAIERLNQKRFDIVVSDVRIDEVDGLDILETVKNTSSSTITILITGFATLELAREAQAKGAFEFIAKPFKPKDLCKVIEKAVREIEKS